MSSLIAAPPPYSTACVDWRQRIVRGESLVPPPIYPAAAAEGLRRFRELRIADAPGSPSIGEAARPWIMDWAAALFGSYNPATGVRDITEYMLLVSKKNWKSGLAASVMLSILLANWRHSAEYGILAPTVEVADNAFKPAREMIRVDPELSALLHVQDHTRTITHRGTHASLKVVAADSEAVSGKKWTGTLVDELWLFGKRASSASMLMEATGGRASRPEGFVIYSSTHADEQPSGVFLEKLRYARGVRDGTIEDPHFLPLLYEWPEEMLARKAYLDPRNFYVTNPNLGASVDEQFLRRELQKAQASGEHTLRVFLAKHLNVEIGQALMSNNWSGAVYWPDNADPALTLDTLLERSEVVVMGVDGGGLDDLLGAAVLGRETGTGRWLAWTRAWLHPVAMERREQNAAAYKDFIAEGNLVLSPEVGADVVDVADVAEKVFDSGKLDRIGVDPVGIGAIVDAIVDRGVPEDQLVTISQGWRLTGAIQTAERKLAAKALLHPGGQMMAWCVAAARIEQRGNAIVITKQTSGAGKIDPLLALLNAVALMAQNPKAASGRSFWDVPEGAAA